MAVELCEDWRDELSVYQRPVPYGSAIEEALKPPEYVPVDALVTMLCAREVAPNALLDYLNSAAAEVARAPRYELTRPPTERLSISELPELPTPQRMVEFLVGLSSDLARELYPENNDWPCKEFDDWRNSMRNVASELEAELGEEVYHFADPESEFDDNVVIFEDFIGERDHARRQARFVFVRAEYVAAIDEIVRVAN